MATICWKCGRNIDGDVKVCPFCGASFIGSDERYQSDGRTISSDDDSAYLRDPIRLSWKRFIRPVSLILLVILLVAAAYVVATGYAGHADGPDIVYNYAMAVHEDGVDPDSAYVYMNVIIEDRTISGLDPEVLYLVLYVNGHVYLPESGGFDPDILMQPGDIHVGSHIFRIPAEYTGERMSVTLASTVSDEWRIERDTSMYV